METDIRNLVGRAVVIVAGEVTYRGVLRELGVNTVLVRGTRGEREIPWDRISRIREDRRSGGR